MSKVQIVISGEYSDWNIESVFIDDMESAEAFRLLNSTDDNDAITCSRECASLSQSPIWEYNGESHRVVEWADVVGINTHCLLHRKEMGWTIEEILTTPFRGKRHAC